ncbi:hypothetical protein QNH46_01035 [Paenibacillus woosongensis]|uniref:Uncharacterized protein n=1 Tax=Paenibacillus woosongensis TaxID=307580 RepID=A0AA95IA83_9BACL|nr:hypothetical protein [Paenibacillus woosongensis]WHX49307.1 hypothetical protein QNH46_01035 [Paenibacillus woosongensis]
MARILSIVLSLTLVSMLLGAVGASAAPVVAPSVDPVKQAIRDVLPKDVEVPADFFVERKLPKGSVSPFAETDVPLKGGYAYSRYFAAGGRVDVEIHQLYLNPTDART